LSFDFSLFAWWSRCPLRSATTGEVSVLFEVFSRVVIEREGEKTVGRAAWDEGLALGTRRRGLSINHSTTKDEAMACEGTYQGRGKEKRRFKDSEKRQQFVSVINEMKRGQS